MRKKCLLLALSVLALGVAAGSGAAVGTEPAAFSEYFAALDKSCAVHTGAVAVNAFAAWAVLFFSAFFKFGAVTASLAVFWRGFVDGYAVTAILRTLGTGGLGMCFFDSPGAPLTVLMCALCLEKLASGGVGVSHYTAKSILLLCGLLSAAVVSGLLAAAVCGAAV